MRIAASDALSSWRPPGIAPSRIVVLGVVVVSQPAEAAVVDLGSVSSDVVVAITARDSFGGRGEHACQSPDCALGRDLVLISGSPTVVTMSEALILLSARVLTAFSDEGYASDPGELTDVEISSTPPANIQILPELIVVAAAGTQTAARITPSGTVAGGDGAVSSSSRPGSWGPRWHRACQL